MSPLATPTMTPEELATWTPVAGASTTSRLGRCIDCGNKCDRQARRCKACDSASRRAEVRHCIDCGGTVTATRKGVKRCMACWKVEIRRLNTARRDANRHKQTAHTIKARPAKARIVDGCAHRWILPPGAGLGAPYVQTCRECNETRMVAS